MLRKLSTATGMRVFFVIWFGQLVSFLGSSLTSFALGIWIYERTGAVTQYAIVLFCATLPPILLAPFAGLLADRWNRRWAMILADTGSALSTLVIVLLLFTDRLDAWHIYLATAFSAVMSTIQLPAYAATIPLLVPAEQLGRANGMRQLSRSIGQLLAPVLGGFLVVAIGLQGVILIDLITFLFAVTTLLLLRFPDVPKTTSAKQPSSWLRESFAGWTYLLTRRGLLSLLIYFAIINFLLGSIEVLVTPLALSITSPDMLGVILFIGGLGMVTGSLIISVWGGPRRKIYGVLISQCIGGACVILAGLNSNIIVLAVVAFVYFFGIPIGDACSTFIFQQKVAAEVRGRVFAVIGAVAGFVLPMSYLIVSALADRVFEPLMMPGAPLAQVFGSIVGTGEGRGIGLMFAIMGSIAMLVTVLAYLYPPLRLIDDDLPTTGGATAPIDSRSAHQAQS